LISSSDAGEASRLGLTQSFFRDADVSHDPNAFSLYRRHVLACEIGGEQSRSCRGSLWGGVDELVYQQGKVRPVGVPSRR